MSIKIAITTGPINSQSEPRLLDKKMDDLLLKEEKTKNKLYTAVLSSLENIPLLAISNKYR